MDRLAKNDVRDEIIIIKSTRGYIDENNIAYLNLEDVARGLGFIQVKNGTAYVRWERVNSHLINIFFPQYVGKEYIPENVFYRLAMNGENESALEFQNMVADEVLPSIRKTGGYIASDEFFIATYMPYADESTKQMFRTSLAMVRNANKKIDKLETELNEFEKYWTIMKFNQAFDLRWDMKTCQCNGEAASVYSRRHGYEIRKCNDERFKETDSYTFEVLEILLLPKRKVTLEAE